MAERSIKIKITGDASGVGRAAKKAKESLQNIGEGGASLFKNLGNAVVSTLSSSGIYGAAALVAAIGTAAPMIGAALAAVIPLAFGGGAIALGIKAALKDPAVAAAFEPLKKTWESITKSFAEPFKGPLVRAAKTFDDALKRMKPTFDEIAKVAAPIIDKLAPALAAMAEKALPGIKTAVEASVPLFEVLAKQAPKFGEAISKFLAAVTKGGPGAQKFLEDTFNFLAWILPKIGELIGWLANRYLDWRKNVTLAVNAVKAAWSALESFFKKIWNTLKSGLNSVITSFNNFKSRVNGNWDSIMSKIEYAVNRITGLWNGLRNLASSAINFSIGGFSIPGLSGARAAGGPVGAGRSYLVGEKGPEILTMGSSSGHITPNHEIGGGGQTINLTVDLGEGIQQAFQIKTDRNNRVTRTALLARGARA